jgi:diguanylate cyclase (GGDEF)-like protein
MLLIWAMLFHLASGVAMLVAGLVGGSLGYGFAILGVVLSGLYMVPCMFMLARTFSRDMPRMVRILDGLIALCVVVLLYALMYIVANMPHETMQAHARELSFLADAVNYSLAVMVSIRFVGGNTRMRRHAYFAAAVYLWVNALAVSFYNRLEDGSLPWWSGLLLQLAFVAVMAVALSAAPRWLRRLRPSPRTSGVIDGFAPIVLSICVLALGISVSRLDFGTGIIVSVLSVLFYGLRMAYIQNRDRYRQREATLSNKRLQQQLTIDPMTGIANRVALDVHLREVLHGRRRGGSACSVLMVDVDLFKQYNDTFGHISGDTCLVRVVSALQENLLRSGDLIARFGGEEFAVVLPDSTLEAAQVVGQRLVEAVAEQNMPHPKSPYGRVTVSVGVATCIHCGEERATDLLDAADRALYRAKREGRNRCIGGDEIAEPSGGLLST